MRRIMKKAAGLVLAAALVVTGVYCGGTDTQASAKALKITMNRKKVNLTVGAKYTLKVKKVTPKKAGKAVTYKTSNRKIATVTRKGVITGKKKGTTKITVTSKSNKKVKTTVKVIVANKPVATPTPVANPTESTNTTAKPTSAPTTEPTASPTPTSMPSTEPTVSPTPTPVPATEPTVSPTPTSVPTTEPTVSPTPTSMPTTEPTLKPTAVPYSWVTTWGTAEENFIASPDRMPQSLNETTVRQIIRVTTSGDEFKLRLSNQYGKSDVTIHSLHIAKQVEADKSTIDVSTDTVVTVGGKEAFTIPAGKVIETDGVRFSVDALDNVAISAYFGKAPNSTNQMTGHRGARATTYQVSGNKVSEKTLSSPTTTLAWYFLADASVMSPEGSKAVVCFGDSITDGYGTDADYLGRKPDSYTRWGDYFAKRLQANDATKHISVINEGIGSNGMMGSYPTDAGKDRFARDLLEHDGVGYCIVLFGVNDLNKLSNTNKYNELKPEYEKMVTLAHKNGIKIYAAPILPFGTSDYYSEASEQVRTMLNNWMRSKEAGFDGVIEFADVLADPANPKNILEKYTHSDGLHPYDGYEAMANAIDLSLFE